MGSKVKAVESMHLEKAHPEASAFENKAPPEGAIERAKRVWGRLSLNLADLFIHFLFSCYWRGGEETSRKRRRQNA